MLKNEPSPSPWRLIITTVSGTLLVVTVLAWCVHSRSSPPQTPIPLADTKHIKRRPVIKGNWNSMIYHVPGCLNYNNIKEENIVWFDTEEAAEDAGYRKAQNCPYDNGSEGE